MIGLVGVTKRYGEQVVLDGLDLDLPDGRVTALMGPNGSGKTTIARLLLGLERPDAGTVQAPRHRSAAFQEDRLCGQLTAVRNVRLALDRTVDGAVVEAELRAVGLDDDALRKPVRELSGGQRRRVAIVRALMPRAELTVLDEPFKGLDSAAREQMIDHIRAAHALTPGRAMLLITHDRLEAEWFAAPVVELPARR